MAHLGPRMGIRLDCSSDSIAIGTRSLWNHQTHINRHRDYLGFWRHCLYLDGGDQGYFAEKDGCEEQNASLDKYAVPAFGRQALSVMRIAKPVKPSPFYLRRGLFILL